MKKMPMGIPDRLKASPLVGDEQAGEKLIQWVRSTFPLKSVN